MFALCGHVSCLNFNYIICVLVFTALFGIPMNGGTSVTDVTSPATRLYIQ